MPESNNIPVFNRIHDTYQFLNLPTDRIDAKSEFDIQKLQEIHTDLPFQSPVFRANYFSFVFVKNGIGYYTIGEQKFDIVPTTIYFTNPGHFKSFRWDQIEEVYFVSLSESFLKENVHAHVFEEFPFLLSETVLPRVMHSVMFAEFDQLCLQILDEYTGDSLYRHQIIGSLFGVILLKIKAYFWKDYNPIYEGDRSSQIVKNFKECLEQHFRILDQAQPPKTLRVQDCADALGLSSHYLSNVIKSKTGKTVTKWIAEKTVIEAKAKLQNISLSVKEVAYRLGFVEPTHFSNYFKKLTGISPMTYRRQLLKQPS